MVFHEITRDAIRAAVDDTARPRPAPGRRPGDPAHPRPALRLRGLPGALEEVLPRLSAGRVQSVATRLVVERERERMAFRAASWQGRDGEPASGGRRLRVPAGGPRRRPLADGPRLRRAAASSTGATCVPLTEDEAASVATALPAPRSRSPRSTETPLHRQPQRPLHDLHAPAGGRPQAALSAQHGDARRPAPLRERAASPTCAPTRRRCRRTAINAARSRRPAALGAEYVPDAPRRYDRKVKNAQEAHEAIRPAGDVFRTPSEAPTSSRGDELRALRARSGSAPSPRRWPTPAAPAPRCGSRPPSPRRPGGPTTPSSRPTAGSITFPGFLRAYVEGPTTPRPSWPRPSGVAARARRGRAVPRRRRGRVPRHPPPARYTEASLVKALEELGIGRPSTYASIMDTIQDRGYVWKKGSALVPSSPPSPWSSCSSSTSPSSSTTTSPPRMEDDLDAIAVGHPGDAAVADALLLRRATPTARPARRLKQAVSEHLADIDAGGDQLDPARAGPERRAILVRVGQVRAVSQARR